MVFSSITPIFLVQMCVYVNMHAHGHGGQKATLDPLELELKTVVIPVWMLGSKLP